MILCFYNFFMFFSVIAFVSQCLHKCPTELWHQCRIFMTCTFGIGMLYSDISLFTYVQIVVYFLNAAFQFYTSKVIAPVRRGSCAYFGGARSWSATGLSLLTLRQISDL